MNLPSQLLVFRRSLLRRIVPEFVWPETVSIDGVNIKVRGQPYSFGVKRCLVQDAYEVPERGLLQRFIEPGMQVLEMGGSIGILAAVVSDKIGPNGRLVSIEADADIAGYSATWLEEGGQTKVLAGFAFPVWELDKAVGVAGFDTASGSLGGTVELSCGESDEAVGRENIWDISRVCRETGLQPDVLICDIEGAESVLLDSAPQLPRSIANVLMEIHPHKFPNGDKDVERICRTIESEGFELREIVGMSYWFSRTE